MTLPKRILLIDDDPALVRLLGLLVAEFRRGPFILEHENDYAGGLRNLLSGGHAVCLLDYKLGARDGLELLREAKAAGCSTPIILLTGSAREETDMAAMDAGAFDFMEKTELTLRGLERAVCYALENAGTLALWRDAATHDKLTGTQNRHEFDRRLLEEWQRSQRLQRPLALVMIDLDNFKQINDTHGHLVGDAMLRHIGAHLSGLIRKEDCLARFGGDEFALIMVETDDQAARAAAARLHAQLCATVCQVPEKQLNLGVEVSMGLASWPKNATTLEELVAAADGALYAAKQQGRNRANVAGDS